MGRGLSVPSQHGLKGPQGPVADMEMQCPGPLKDGLDAHV